MPSQPSPGARTAVHRPQLDVGYYLELLAEQGPVLVTEAHRADAGDRIPFCPDWTRDDLVTHTTSVYRWVELIVRGARNRPPALPEPESDALADPVGALSAAHHDVLEALRAAPLRSTVPTSLGLTCSGTGSRWWVRIGPDAPELGRGPATVDTEVTAQPGALLLLLWNRRKATGLDVRGDGRALDVWVREAHL
ncbi:maleylpyruvate isomerase N-terminal domain-containing protein [Amycolatopsis sp. NPDC005232]|uniref:maleylpyruvate isomerase N-terminal domain-containing protein n=1 Tax=Amycolatopsis sp. NPDC005232 TaxID=3157027 RepID=UPI0033B436CD